MNEDNTVYLLEYGRPHPQEPATIEGIFTTYELAKQYAEVHHLNNWEISEYILNKGMI